MISLRRTRTHRESKNERVIVIAPVGQDAVAMATSLELKVLKHKFAMGWMDIPGNDR